MSFFLASRMARRMCHAEVTTPRHFHSGVLVDELSEGRHFFACVSAGRAEDVLVGNGPLLPNERGFVGQVMLFAVGAADRQAGCYQSLGTAGVVEASGKGGAVSGCFQLRFTIGGNSDATAEDEDRIVGPLVPEA